ncbi:MAG: O-methyltransferase [Thermoplasmata archaeon]
MATEPRPEWVAVDRYTESLLVRSDPALDRAIASSRAAGLPAIQVAPNQGQLLQILARAVGARRILEIGLLGGYSTTWLARALPPGGRLISLEVDAHHAEVAQANLAAAGLADRVEVRVGRAIESMRAMEAAHEPPFDFIFLDADKVSYPDYLDSALRLAHTGSLIAADNVVRGGEVADAQSADPNVVAVREMNTRIAHHPELVATTIQTVGVKGYDGFTLALVTRAGSV